MSILKDLIKETAAGGAMGVVSAHSVAGFRSPLGVGDKKKKKKKVMRRGPVGTIYGFRFVGESRRPIISQKEGEKYTFTSFLTLSEAEDSEFDSSNVIAKLKGASKSAEAQGEDTTAFALEDENGDLVKVWVPEDQADEFEIALSSALSGEDEDDDEQNNSLEIAEVLWNLRKEFDIVNVEWAEIPEDQEEAAPAPAGAEGAPGETAAGEAGAARDDTLQEPGSLEGETGPELEGEPGEEDMVAGAEEEPDAASALQQVIDAMKADAEARKAEAQAKEAEARAREAEATAKQAEEKVKQEEEILDMEAYYDDEKEKKAETDRLAKLAKYRHDLAGDSEAGLSSPPVEAGEDTDMMPDGSEPEDEELAMSRYAGVGGRGRGAGYISRSELGDLIIQALRRQ